MAPRRCDRGTSLRGQFSGGGSGGEEEGVRRATGSLNGVKDSKKSELGLKLCSFF